MGFNVSVWSVTSYNELYRDAQRYERERRLHPLSTETELNEPILHKLFGDLQGSFVAVSDYMKSLPNSIAPWMPEPFITLGTDGYGLSESRADLREYFEINASYICHAALVGLLREGSLNETGFERFAAELAIDCNKQNPADR